jgi:hypothetical protein
MSIGTLVLLWAFCAIFVSPIIVGMGLTRSHADETEVTPEQWQLRVHHVLGYLGLVFGTAGIVYQVARLDSSSGGQLLLFLIGYPVVFIVLGVASLLFRGIRAKNGYFLVLCTLFIVGILTYQADERVADAKMTHYEDTIAEIAAVHNRAMREWLDDLEAAGAHGPAGEMPPMLRVSDSGAGTRVRNLASQSVCVRVSRQRQSPDGQGRTQCLLMNPRRGANCTIIGVDREEWFELPDREHADCAGQPLSFRVGDSRSANIVWWSDPELDLLEREIRKPTGHYGSTGSFTADEALGQYRALLRQGDRAALWRAHLEAADLVESVGESPEPAAAPASAEFARELNAAHKRIVELERVAGKIEPAEGNLPSWLILSRDWQGTVVLANNTSSDKWVRLVRLAEDAEGRNYLCAMRGDDSGARGTLIKRRDSATFTLDPASYCAVDKRPPLQVEVRNEEGSLMWVSPDLLGLRLNQARSELRVLESAAR